MISVFFFLLFFYFLLNGNVYLEIMTVEILRLFPPQSGLGLVT